MKALLRSLLSFVVVALCSCAGGAPEGTPAEASAAVPSSPDCEAGGGMCLPNTNSAPPTYRQAKMEEGVCARRDEICWLRQ